MVIELKMCKINGDKDDCFSVKLTRRIFWYTLAIVVLMAVINFWIGLAIGGPIVALFYVAYSFSLSLLALAMCIPVVGLVIAIGFFNIITGNMQSLLSIVSNFWIDALTISTFWLGLVVQIFLLVYIIWTLVMKKRK